jgi:hypothetical protein
LLFKKKIELKQLSSSLEPMTWIMVITTNFKYFRKNSANSYDAWIARQNLVTRFTKIGLALSVAKATISTMA